MNKKVVIWLCVFFGVIVFPCLLLLISIYNVDTSYKPVGYIEDNKIDKYLDDTRFSEDEEDESHYNEKLNTVRKMFLEHKGRVNFHAKDIPSPIVWCPEVTVLTNILEKYKSGEYENGKEDLKVIIEKWETCYLIEFLVKINLMNEYKELYGVRLEPKGLEDELATSFEYELRMYDTVCKHPVLYFDEFIESEQSIKLPFSKKWDLWLLSKFRSGGHRQVLVDLVALAKAHEWEKVRAIGGSINNDIRLGKYNSDIVLVKYFAAFTGIIDSYFEAIGKETKP